MKTRGLPPPPIIALWLLAAAATACAVRQPVQMQTEFDSGEHPPYAKMGTNTIKGQGFLRQQGGGIVTCAGSTVVLVPATLFFREFINHPRSGKKPELVGIDPGLRGALIKRSQCDAQGNFLFSSVADGNWFVLTDVKWAVGYAKTGRYSHAGACGSKWRDGPSPSNREELDREMSGRIEVYSLLLMASRATGRRWRRAGFSWEGNLILTRVLTGSKHVP